MSWSALSTRFLDISRDGGGWAEHPQPRLVLHPQPEPDREISPGIWGMFHIPHLRQVLLPQSIKAGVFKAPNISSSTCPPYRRCGKSHTGFALGGWDSSLWRKLLASKSAPHQSKSQKHPARACGWEHGARLVLNTALDPNGKKENHPGTAFPGFGQPLVSSESSNQKWKHGGSCQGNSSPSWTWLRRSPAPGLAPTWPGGPEPPCQLNQQWANGPASRCV